MFLRGSTHEYFVPSHWQYVGKCEIFKMCQLITEVTKGGILEIKAKTLFLVYSLLGLP